MRHELISVALRCDRRPPARADTGAVTSARDDGSRTRLNGVGESRRTRGVDGDSSAACGRPHACFLPPTRHVRSAASNPPATPPEEITHCQYALTSDTGVIPSYCAVLRSHTLNPSPSHHNYLRPSCIQMCKDTHITDAKTSSISMQGALCVTRTYLVAYRRHTTLALTFKATHTLMTMCITCVTCS